MKKSLILAVAGMALFASPAWCILHGNKKQEAYLETTLSDIQDRLKAVKAQVALLAKALADSEQKQGQLQTTVGHQEQEIQDLKNTIISLQLAQDSGFNNVSSALAGIRSDEKQSLGNLEEQIREMKAQLQAASSTLQGVPTSGASAPANAAETALPQSSALAVKGYITNVDNDVITVGLGSSAGLHPGSRLDLYKGDDSTPVGVLEVTDVIGSGSSHAKLVSLNEGVKPEFSDVVRPQP